jgi:hypothetical protein
MKETRRGRVRAKYDTNVAITDGKTTISSDHTQDISLNGVSIISNKSFPVGSECDLTITLNSTVAHLQLRLNCTVVREMENGFAVTFKEMDIETYQHLKNIILYNSDDPEAFLRQCEERPGFK